MNSLEEIKTEIETKVQKMKYYNDLEGKRDLVDWLDGLAEKLDSLEKFELGWLESEAFREGFDAGYSKGYADGLEKRTIQDLTVGAKCN